MTLPPLPCPFCGSTNIRTDDARDFLACMDCHAEGPGNIGMGSNYAVEAWNRRAAIAAHVPEADCGNIAAVPAQPDRLYDALCWALGVGDDWKPRPDGAGPFYWRKELAERAGICWDGSRYVMAAQPVQQPGAEPFAHICVLPTKDAGPTKFFTAPSDPRGFPVYLAAPAQRQPLSDNQLDTIATNHWSDVRKDALAAHKAFANPLDAHRAFARAIEAAHNITAAPAAQKGEKK